MKWDRAVSNYKKHCIVVSHTHLISDNFLSLQTPFAIALMAMAGEGSYEVGETGGCKLTAYDRPPNTVMNTRMGGCPRSSIQPPDSVTDCSIMLSGSRSLSPRFPPPPGSFLFPVFPFSLEKTLCIISHIKLLLVQR